MRRKLTILLLLANPLLLMAQGQNLEIDTGKSNIQVQGTSTIHDWDMETKLINGNTYLVKKESVLVISKTNISIKATNLKGDISGMDDKAYEALKVKKHPNITFSQTNELELHSTGKNFKGTIKGNLTISGKTKAVSIPITANTLQNQLIVEGEIALKMTSFNIEPPRAMLGTIKAEDNIKINFELILK